ncbi:type II toxin-antitoxin system VapC family toxin [Candidatus Woesearchaeota archaeon]|nr:type II toxin-antitoxin system VapC family toxin [Candidatus Woesearchaeota archaeon]
MIGLDSSVLIEILRDRASVAELRKYSEEEFCTSEIAAFEILYGAYALPKLNERKLMAAETLLDSLAYVFPVERKAARKAAEIAGHLSKSGQTIGHTDALIAGSLLANGCKKFITKNIKDFERIKELELVK